MSKELNCFNSGRRKVQEVCGAGIISCAVISWNQLCFEKTHGAWSAELVLKSRADAFGHASHRSGCRLHVGTAADWEHHSPLQSYGHSSALLCAMV